MEPWRIGVAGICGLCVAGCLLCAVLSLAGKGDVPFDKVLIGGSYEQKEKYKRKAGQKAAAHYLFVAAFAGVLAGLGLYGDTKMVVVGSLILCGLLWAKNKL